MTSEEINQHNPDEEKKEETFWNRHGANIGLAILIIYVILLAIGTAAEIFEMDAILNWWIFRPPGR